MPQWVKDLLSERSGYYDWVNIAIALSMVVFAAVIGFVVVSWVYNG